MESKAFKWQREERRINWMLQAERHYWLEDYQGRILVKTVKVGSKYAYSVLYPNKQYRTSVDKYANLDEAYSNAAAWWSRNKNVHVARFATFSLNFNR